MTEQKIKELLKQAEDKHALGNDDIKELAEYALAQEQKLNDMYKVLRHFGECVGSYPTEVVKMIQDFNLWRIF